MMLPITRRIFARRNYEPIVRDFVCWSAVAALVLGVLFVGFEGVALAIKEKPVCNNVNARTGLGVDLSGKICRRVR
jgi:uncharacterized membrane protein YjfL (UPF0719 family)